MARCLLGNGRTHHGTGSSHDHHDHARRQAGHTAIASFTRAAKPGIRHQPQGGRNMARFRSPFRARRCLGKSGTPCWQDPHHRGGSGCLPFLTRQARPAKAVGRARLLRRGACIAPVWAQAVRRRCRPSLGGGERTSVQAVAPCRVARKGAPGQREGLIARDAALPRREDFHQENLATAKRLRLDGLRG